MAQPLKAFLTELAQNPDLRRLFADDPIQVGLDNGIEDVEVIKVIVESDLKAIRAALIDEAKAAGEGGKPGIAKPMVTIDN